MREKEARGCNILILDPGAVVISWVEAHRTRSCVPSSFWASSLLKVRPLSQDSSLDRSGDAGDASDAFH